MRYATFATPEDPQPRLGVVDDAHMIDVGASLAPAWPAVPRTLLGLILAGPDAWARVAPGLGLDGRASGGSRCAAACVAIPLGEIRWHAPIPRPRRNVICLGLNYAAHVREGAAALGRTAQFPAHPIFFSKMLTAVTGPYDDIAVDTTVTRQVDWEVELGVVIGAGGRNITRADAMRHVFGYTIVNDLSARDLQFRSREWLAGKSLDGFCPTGPVVVTADEFGDPRHTRLRLCVNGVEKQRGTTRDMIFPVDVILEALSLGMALEPGDLIATGTPDGVGFSRTPPEFLVAGDVVEAEVDGIGVLRNRITRPGPPLPAPRPTVQAI